MTVIADTANPDHVPGRDGMLPGERARGRVLKLMEFRAGDGPMIQIHPDYALELERAPQSIVVSWQEDGQPMNAAIPVGEFDIFLAGGQITIEK